VVYFKICVILLNYNCLEFRLVLFFTKYDLCLFHFGKNISKFRGITTLTRKQKDSLLKIYFEWWLALKRVWLNWRSLLGNVWLCLKEAIVKAYCKLQNISRYSKISPWLWLKQFLFSIEKNMKPNVRQHWCKTYTLS
jgi:hypothetical protein